MFAYLIFKTIFIKKLKPTYEKQLEKRRREKTER